MKWRKGKRDSKSQTAEHASAFFQRELTGTTTSEAGGAGRGMILSGVWTDDLAYVFLQGWQCIGQNKLSQKSDARHAEPQ